MKITQNLRNMCYEVYCDTDSKYKFMSEWSKGTIDQQQIMKLHLNSIYGKVVTNMNKDYIIAHETNSDGLSAVTIIFKSHICAVHKHADGTADIVLDNGLPCYSIDKYEDIIKQLI